MNLLVATLMQGASMFSSATPCNSLTGVWNAKPNAHANHHLVRIQDSSDGSLTAAWWLPNPDTNVTGSIDGRNFRAGNLNAFISTSPWTNVSAPVPECSLLTFPDYKNATWCLQPWCPDTPTPPTPAPPPPQPENPETFMPLFKVPDAAEQGAFYPNGQPAYFYMNHTGAKGWVIHLVCALFSLPIVVECVYLQMCGYVCSRMFGKFPHFKFGFSISRAEWRRLAFCT